MKYITEFISADDTAVTIGKFDGFHLGHMRLFSRVKEYAAMHGLRTAAVSFSPHPAEVLGEIRDYKTIFNREEKKNILEDIGVDIYLEYPFTGEFAQTSPQRFAEEMLFKGLRCKYVAVGSGYRFGEKQKGTSALLRELAKNNGACADIAESVKIGGETLSSSLIRQYIRECDFEGAGKLMYKPFFVSGRVVHGRKIGRSIGVPTVNLIPDPKKLLPPDGVYLTRVNIGGEYADGVTNVGTNPTVSALGQITVETHMLDYDKLFYGEEIKVVFIKKLRDVIKFDDIEQLKKQIEEDILRARGLI